MTDRELVDGIIKEIIDFGGKAYEKLYRSPQQAAPEIDLFESLDDHQKVQFLRILREVQIDTAASLLGFIDGDFWIENQEKELMLTYGDNKIALNGSLADIFLESVRRLTSSNIESQSDIQVSRRD
jgi:hypothetical protein